MNTPRVVMQETKKAFRAIAKKNDLEAAVSALSNLKGVGPAMASGNLKGPGPSSYNRRKNKYNTNTNINGTSLYTIYSHVI